MSEQRRATVMLIQRGDPEIAGALVDGMIAARGNRDIERQENSPVDCFQRDGAGRPLGTGNRNSVPEARPVESVEIVTVERDKWRRVARQVHVAVGRNLTTEDYRMMIVKARCDYAVHRRHSPMRDAAGMLLLAWALLWEGIRRAYRAQDRVLRP